MIQNEHSPIKLSISAIKERKKISDIVFMSLFYTDVCPFIIEHIEY